MQLVRLFTGLENDCEGLTEEINHWIRESGIKILQVHGNIAPQSTNPAHNVEGLASGRPPSDLFVIVLYET
jgi:hypothetical protein